MIALLAGAAANDAITGAKPACWSAFNSGEATSKYSTERMVSATGAGNMPVMATGANDSNSG